MAKNDVTVELYYSGAWQDITILDHVYTRDPIRITRGRPDQSTRTPPSTCSLSIKNTDGRYSIRNPTSPLYGLIGRNTPIRVTCNGSVRFVGEVESWPLRWNVTGSDVWAPITANGITRRLNAPGTTAPSLSALHRLVVAEATPPVAFWAMATPASYDLASPEMRVADITGSASPDLSWQTGSQGSALGDAFSTSARDIYTRPRTTITLDTDVATDSVLTAKPTANTSSFTLSNRIGGTFFVNMVGSWVTGVPTLTLTSNSGTLDTAAAADATAVWDQAPHAYRVTMTQNGANIDVTVDMDGVEIMSGSTASTALSGTAKFLPGLISANRADCLWSHVAVWSGSSPTTPDVYAASTGHLGETAAERIERLLTEEGITYTGVGTDSALMGVQRVAPFVELLTDAADADGGILVETRSALGYTYRTHASLYNQDPAAELDYAAGGEVAPPLEPVDDTDATANDVTVTRFDGAKGNAVQESGTLNVQEPPTGVGRYRKDFTLVLASDSQAYQHAAWLRHLGTWDEPRYPQVRLDLTAMAVEGRTALIADAAALDCGDRFTISSTPAWLPPGPITLLAEGFIEDIESHLWRITVNATPEGPWQVGVLDSATNGKLDCNGSTVATAIDQNDTTVSVTVTDHCLWSTTAEPYDVVIDGEVMTVTACTGSSSPQSFTVVRSVNGAIQSHAAGAEIHVHKPFRLARS